MSIKSTALVAVASVALLNGATAMGVVGGDDFSLSSFNSDCDTSVALHEVCHVEGTNRPTCNANPTNGCGQCVWHVAHQRCVPFNTEFDCQACAYDRMGENIGDIGHFCEGLHSNSQGTEAPKCNNCHDAASQICNQFHKTNVINGEEVTRGTACFKIEDSQEAYFNEYGYWDYEDQTNGISYGNWYESDVTAMNCEFHNFSHEGVFEGQGKCDFSGVKRGHTMCFTDSQYDCYSGCQADLGGSTAVMDVWCMREHAIKFEKCRF